MASSIQSVRIHDLDDDSLLMIFGQLTFPKQLAKLELVCKRWKQLMTRFWRQLTHIRLNPRKHFFHHSMKDKELLAIVNKCPNVRSFDLSDLKLNIRSETADRWTQLCPQVEELKLNSTRIPSNIFTHMLHHFPSLRKINIEEMKGLEIGHFDILFSEHSDLVEFAYLGDRCVSGNLLRRLKSPLQRFEMFNIVSGHAVLSSLETNCRNSLQKLRIAFRTEEVELFRRIFSSFQQLNEMELFTASTQNLKNLPALPLLHRLALTVKQWDQNVINFLKSYPQLTYLKMRTRRKADLDFFRKTVDLLPNLLFFDHNGQKFSDEELTIFFGWTHLQHICFTPGLNYKGYCRLVRGIPTLKKVTITEDALFSSGLKQLTPILNKLRDVLQKFAGRKLAVDFGYQFGHLLFDGNSSNQSLNNFLLAMRSAFEWIVAFEDSDDSDDLEFEDSDDDYA